MSGWPDYEDIYEWDFGEPGSWMGMHMLGHFDDETATAYAWAVMVEEYRDHTIQPPVRTWVRKVPCRDGSYSFAYSRKPGRGATAVTRIDVQGPWRLWCDVRRCTGRFVPGSATCGVSTTTFANPEAWFGDDPEPQEPRQSEYRYLCRDHAERYHAAMKTARAEAVEAYRRSIGAVA